MNSNLLKYLIVAVILLFMRFVSEAQPVISGKASFVYVNNHISPGMAIGAGAIYQLYGLTNLLAAHFPFWSLITS